MKLEDIPFFEGFTQAEIDMIKGCLMEKTYEKGEILLHEREGCNRIFIVQTGRIKLYRLSPSGREQILQTLTEGDTCACNPGKAGWSCGATAEATVRTTVWHLSRDDYLRMVRSNIHLVQSLNQILAERLCIFGTLIEEVSLKDTKARVVKFLLDMSDSRDNPGRGKREVLSIPFTREEIAQRIGAARETVSRQLNALKRARLIDMTPRKIIICDKPALQKLLD